MSYASNEYRDADVVSMLLFGSAASIPLLHERLALALETEVMPVRLGDIVQCDSGLADEAGKTAFTVATGLALYDHVEAA
jgi:hypothetical protein